MVPLGVLATLAVAGAVFGATVASTSPNRGPQPPLPIGPRAPEGVPFPGAVRADLAGAERMLGYTIMLPSDPLASNGSMEALWITPERDGILEAQYLSGIKVDLTNAPPPDPRAHFEGLAEQLGEGIATVQIVLGQPALVIEQNVPNGCDPTQPDCTTQDNPGSVEFVLGGVTITIYGHYSGEELLRVASSVTVVGVTPSPVS